MAALGAVFTPPAWAQWAVDRLRLPVRVAAGATVCDPTAGEGAFAFALADRWAQDGSLDPARAARITLIDREGTFLETFARLWRQRYGFGFPEANLVETDVVARPPDRQFDLVVGNPPWVTYPDLSPQDQDLYRPWFRHFELVGRPSELLLGRSRLDVAALVTARAFTTLLRSGGEAGFFLPLSLFHSGAAARWRRWVPHTVYDLTDAGAFPGVSTRYGWAEFGPRAPASPRYFTGSPDAWELWDAVQDGPGTPWRLVVPGTREPVPQFSLSTAQRPRQGINTGGANGAFHVEAPPSKVDPAMVHPLVRPGKSEKWILVPYHRDGRIFDETELRASGLQQFWEGWRGRLAARKGLYLGSQLQKGRWWALLGVGPYAFAPYKVLWSAYGQRRLEPQVWGPRDDGRIWQADQALQAYVPCSTEEEALRVAEFLASDAVHRYLASFRDAGTRSWAQPGRLTPLWSPPPGSGTGEGTTGR